MAAIEAKGLVLPPPLALPPAVTLPFPWVSVRGDRVFVSGHGPQEDDGFASEPKGKAGAEVSEAQGYDLAHKTALSMLGSLQRELGDLARAGVRLNPGATLTW